MARTGIRATMMPACLVLAWACGLWGCTPRAELGDTCDQTSECVNGAQCFAGRCIPACVRNPECGDGAACVEGTCVPSQGEVGSVCASEAQCAAGLACRVADAATGEAMCQPEMASLADGAACDAHDQCRHGACMFNRCVSLCAGEVDCFVGEQCQRSPFLQDRFAPASGDAPAPPLVGHCLPATSTLSFDVPVHNEDGQYTWIPVPSGALSFTVGTSAPATSALVGAAALVAPNQTFAYTWPATDNEYVLGARYVPSPGTSRLTWPRPNGGDLQQGAYRADLGVFSPARTRLPAPARAHVVVRMLPLSTVDLVVHLLDSDDHPCTSPLNEATVETSDFATVYLPALRTVLLQAGMTLGRVTYQDVVDRGDLDEIAEDDLAALQEGGYLPGSLNMYVVRSITPAGLAVVSRNVPAAATNQFMPAPMALSLAARCYLSWEQLARATARELAIHAGVWPTVDLGGINDQFVDTPQTAENLLYPLELGGTQLSSSQRFFWREHMVVP